MTNADTATPNRASHAVSPQTSPTEPSASEAPDGRRSEPSGRVLPLDRSDMALAGALGLVELLIHLPVLTRYGYHHDELYFLACGRHADFGYVDHPPMVPWLARAAHELFGPSLFGLRFLASLAIALAVVLLALLVRRIGGGRWAMALAAGAWMLGPVALRVGNLFCIPAFEPVIWLAAVHLLVSILEQEEGARGRDSWWLALGLICGLGLLVKHSMLFFGLGLVLALVVTPRGRRHLTSPWLYAGGSVALLVVLPHLLWQQAHGWPTLQFMSSLRAHVIDGISRPQFVLGQFLYQGFGGALLWLAGLRFFFGSGPLSERRFRYLGIPWLVIFGILLAIKGKIYYPNPAYPMLFAGGAVLFERMMILGSPAKRRAIGVGLPVLIALLALSALPLSLPIFDIDRTERYIDTITFGALGNVYELTADLRGMFGWPERVDAVAAVYGDLPEEERQRASIIASWYGPAGAIDYFGAERGLPAAVSTHMSYHLWGPTADTPPEAFETVVAVDMPEADLRQFFEQVELAKVVELQDVNPWDREFTIHVCRDPKVDIRQVWPELGRYGFD